MFAEMVYLNRGFSTLSLCPASLSLAHGQVAVRPLYWLTVMASPMVMTPLLLAKAVPVRTAGVHQPRLSRRSSHLEITVSGSPMTLFST